MFAIILSGGKQHRVCESEILRVEKLPASVGDRVDIDTVLMIGEGADVEIGTPYVTGAKVTAEVLEHARGDKIRIVKVRRRKNSRRQQGHRQWFTKLRIESIYASGRMPKDATDRAETIQEGVDHGA